MLTTAHYVYNTSRVTSIAGSRNPHKHLNEDDDDGNEQIRKVDRIRVHHGYDHFEDINNTTDIRHVVQCLVSIITEKICRYI